MKNIKMIFFDIDGTLIDMGKKTISPKMVETLIELKKREIIICLATGRSPIALPYFEEIEFDAFLTFNCCMIKVYVNKQCFINSSLLVKG